MIYQKAVEEAMREFSNGDYSLRNTGAYDGMSYEDWERTIRKELRESKYSIPRCMRHRQRDVNTHIEEVNKILDDRSFYSVLWYNTSIPTKHTD